MSVSSSLAVVQTCASILCNQGEVQNAADIAGAAQSLGDFARSEDGRVYLGQTTGLMRDIATCLSSAACPADIVPPLVVCFG